MWYTISNHTHDLGTWRKLGEISYLSQGVIPHLQLPCSVPSRTNSPIWPCLHSLTHVAIVSNFSRARISFFRGPAMQCQYWHQDLAVMESTAPWHIWFSSCGTSSPYWLYWIILNSLFKILRKAWNKIACWLLHETHVCSFVLYVELEWRRKEISFSICIYLKLKKKKNPNAVYGKQCFRKIKRSFTAPHTWVAFINLIFFLFTEDLTVTF